MGEYLAGDTQDAYHDCYTQDFKEKCPFSDFGAIIAYAATAYEQYYDVEFDDIEFRVTNVRFEEGKGYTTTAAFVDGVALNPEASEDPGEYWIYEDGEWRSSDDDEKPCEVPAKPNAE